MKTTSSFLKHLLPAWMAMVLLNGCGNPATSAVKKLYQPSADTDVTSSPQYNFSSFTGTVWKAKVKVALSDGKRYTGVRSIDLIPPKYFDPTHPDYTSTPGSQIITVLPVGTRVRIGRLMKDNGAWGGLLMTGELENVTNLHSTVYISKPLWGNNKSSAPSPSTHWELDGEIMEKDDSDVPWASP